MVLEITPDLFVPEADHEFRFSRSGGPGGQNVNKVSSKVELRVNLASPVFPEELRQRLITLAGRRLTGDGWLVVTSSRTRDQLRNREDCVDKLRALVVRAGEAPRLRQATRPSRASVEQRLAAKRSRAATKHARGTIAPEE
ncbi:MAG: aminoacyl-tRNA hydrolase [Deltaproteobacteria bacterium]|nr:aminoacyl-tRNA hydrolase [Deltaproteobacteria bacterium]